MSPEARQNSGADIGCDKGLSSDSWLILTTVALGAMFAPLNSTMIAVVIPDIMGQFHIELTQAGWLVTAYLIAMASLQPVAGKIGDRIGRRHLIIGGLAVFGVVSIAAALAPNLWVLLLFRIMQAFAGALLIPNGAALLRKVIPERRRASSFGLVGGAVALAATSGPLLGGVLVETAGWQAIFT